MVTKNLRIFERFEEQNPAKSPEKAVVVGIHWHRFSEVGPWFDCQAAAMVSNNRIRHYIVQVAFEELGMRDEREIHHDLFWQAARLVGATDKDLERLSKDEGVTESLKFLERAILSASSDAQVLGMMLGLEIPARENIETIFNSLAHNPRLEKTLAETKFFKIHRQLEIEHIRLSAANFLRFCRTKREREQFVMGCDQGLKFWEFFWAGVSQGIRIERGSFNA